MGLEKAKLIGENGCVIFYSATLEETRLAERLTTVDEIEEKILVHFKEKVWFQPNRVALFFLIALSMVYRIRNTRYLDSFLI